MLRVTGPGRAEVEAPSPPDEDALRTAVERAFSDDTLTSVGWWIPVGDWTSRRTAWRLGFSYGGVLRGWVGTPDAPQDAWAFTLRRDDPREPQSQWLDNPVVQGDGVRLRPFAAADVPRLVEAIGDPQTQYWLAFLPREPGPADGVQYLENVTERLATDHTITWVFADDDDVLLGAVGLFRLDREPELGYWAHPDARGRGLTTRAARLALGYAFDALRLDRVAAYASATNAGSLHVLEAVGMRRVGVQRRAARTGDGTVVDLVGYDLLAEEYAAASTT